MEARLGSSWRDYAMGRGMQRITDTSMELAICLYTDSCSLEHLPAYRVELS